MERFQGKNCPPDQPSCNMALSAGDHQPNNRPHLGIIPSAGMGHVGPFIRFAAALSARQCCDISFITSQPTVSSAESSNIANLLASFPEIQPLNLPLVDLDSREFPPATTDPFILRWEALRRSAHLLPPLLAAAPAPFSALVVDVTTVSTFLPVAKALNLPCYILFISSAYMLSLVAHFPSHSGAGDIVIPGLWTLPKASLPAALHDPNHLFTVQFAENGRILPKADGILVNTFESLEPEALAALNGGHVVANFPPVFAIGPLDALLPPAPKNNNRSAAARWLDQQPEKSVVYVGFGNRTAMTSGQIKELGIGLETSEQRFLWVIKTKKVDRDDHGTELEQLLGEGYTERVKGRGLVINGWVEQEEILGHPAIGVFFSHCGWNSVTEAATAGVRVLGWASPGDQRVNAEVVRRSGLGVWVEEWSWEAEEGGVVVGGEEIARKVKEVMEDEGLKVAAERVREEAAMAVEAGGSSDLAWGHFIAKLIG